MVVCMPSTKLLHKISRTIELKIKNKESFFCKIHKDFSVLFYYSLHIILMSLDSRYSASLLKIFHWNGVKFNLITLLYIAYSSFSDKFKYFALFVWSREVKTKMWCNLYIYIFLVSTRTRFYTIFIFYAIGFSLQAFVIKFPNCYYNVPSSLVKSENFIPPLKTKKFVFNKNFVITLIKIKIKFCYKKIFNERRAWCYSTNIQ